MDEKNEDKKATYRRSTRRISKDFHTPQVVEEDKEREEYDEDYRFEHESHNHTIRSYRKVNLGKNVNFDDDNDDEENEKEGSSSTFRSSFFSNSASYLQLLFLAFLFSLSFYSFPFFHRVATGTASVNLYSGFAMNHGMTPYNELFGSAGPLFYLVNQIGSVTGSTLILWLCEVIALWASGIVTFDILQEMLGHKSLSTVIAGTTMLAIAGISLGADQAILFALPFALYGMRVLNRYFVDDEAAKDEVFILFGVSGALASLFFPLFLMIWLLGTLGLLGRNIALQNLARGFYQLLAGLFGFLLVFSFVGYYTLTTQIFYPTVEQSVILPFTHLNLSASGAMNLVISLGLVLLFGLLSSWFYGFYYATNGNHKIWTTVLLIIGMASLVFVSFMNGYAPANTLVILPFAFMYLGLHIDREQMSAQYTLVQTITRYIRATATLPVLGLIFLLIFPIADNMLNSNYISSERAVASYIEKNSRPSDRLIVLSDSLEINRLAKRGSDVMLPPSYYPLSYLQALDINVSMAKTKFIVLDDKVVLPDSLKTTLSSTYTAVKFDDSHFKIYQIK